MYAATGQRIDAVRLLTETFVPGTYYYNLASEADAQGRPFEALGWYMLGHTDVGLAMVTFGMGTAVAAPARGGAGAVRVTASGLTRVEAHLDAVLVNQQIPRVIQTGERAMLERLRSGLATPQDIEFYLHELKESAIFRRTGDLPYAHAEALRWRGATEQMLFHSDVIARYPEFFSPAWRN
jgi:hypothetical protein